MKSHDWSAEGSEDLCVHSEEWWGGHRAFIVNDQLFHMMAMMMIITLAVTSNTGLVLYFSDSSVKKFFSYQIPESQLGKKLQTVQPISPVHCTHPLQRCHDGDDDDHHDADYYGDDDDDDTAFGRPPKTDRTAIAQSREGEDDGLFGPQYIQDRPPYSYEDRKKFLFKYFVVRSSSHHHHHPRNRHHASVEITSSKWSSEQENHRHHLHPSGLLNILPSLKTHFGYFSPLFSGLRCHSIVAAHLVAAAAPHASSFPTHHNFSHSFTSPLPRLIAPPPDFWFSAKKSLDFHKVSQNCSLRCPWCPATSSLPVVRGSRDEVKSDPDDCQTSSRVPMDHNSATSGDRLEIKYHHSAQSH